MMKNDVLTVLIRRFCGFAGVGGGVTLLSMVLIFIENEWLKLPPLLSYAIAYLVTLVLSYWLNAKLVFHSPFRLRGLIFRCIFIGDGNRDGIAQSTFAIPAGGIRNNFDLCGDTGNDDMELSICRPDHGLVQKRRKML